MPVTLLDRFTTSCNGNVHVVFPYEFSRYFAACPMNYLKV